MPRPALEVADVFRAHGPTWRKANVGHVSLEQLKVMSAIENCRTATLGGHVMRCDDCAHTLIAYNSCRNRHCPKCQGATAREWLAAREADLLPVPLCSVVIYVLIGSELPVGRPRVEFEEGITICGCHWPTVTTETVVASIARLFEGYAGRAAQRLPANRMVDRIPGIQF